MAQTGSRKSSLVMTHTRDTGVLSSSISSTVVAAAAVVAVEVAVLPPPAAPASLMISAPYPAPADALERRFGGACWYRAARLMPRVAPSQEPAKVLAKTITTVASKMQRSRTTSPCRKPITSIKNTKKLMSV